jgi:hypothetical protein
VWFARGAACTQVCHTGRLSADWRLHLSVPFCRVLRMTVGAVAMVVPGATMVPVAASVHLRHAARGRCHRRRGLRPLPRSKMQAQWKQRPAPLGGGAALALRGRAETGGRGVTQAPAAPRKVPRRPRCSLSAQPLVGPTQSNARLPGRLPRRPQPLRRLTAGAVTAVPRSPPTGLLPETLAASEWGMNKAQKTRLLLAGTETRPRQEQQGRCSTSSAT